VLSGVIVDKCEGELGVVMDKSGEAGGVERRRGVVVGEYERDAAGRVFDSECEGVSERRCFMGVCEGRN
jgi:hypothetical protein